MLKFSKCEAYNMPEIMTPDGELVCTGDRVEVVGLGEHEKPPDWEKPEVSHRGVVTNIEENGFKFKIQSPNSGEGAKYTVDFDRGVVERLIYRAGGDEDWASQELVSVTVIDS